MAARPALRARVCALAPLLLATACGGGWSNDSGYTRPTPGTNPKLGPSADHPQGIHAAGNLIEDGDGNVLTLRGVNRSGTEYRCVQGSIFDGPNDEESVQAMASWGINAVRVPLNESCWLGINGVPAARGGDAYKSAIVDYVALLHRYALVPIIELHWTAPGDSEAISQPLVPDLDHAPDTWADIAATFADDSGVIFEPFNEPVYNYYFKDTEDAWSCWRDGCEVPAIQQGSHTIPGLQATGMQSLLDAIRASEGAAGTPSHLVLFGGLNYSNDLGGWLAHAPADAASNVGAAWHIYNFNGCRSDSCFDGSPAELALDYPLLVTELGENTCAGTFVTGVMSWLDAHQLGYLAWSWNVNGACTPGSDSSSNPWSLVTNYTTGEPNSDYARAFHDHFLSLAPAP